MRSAAIDLRFGTAEDWPAIQALRLEQSVRNGQDDLVAIPEGSVWAVAYEDGTLIATFAMSEHECADDSVYVVSDLYCEQSRRGRRAVARLFAYLYEINERKDLVSAVPAGNPRMLDALLLRGWEVESHLVRRRKVG